MELNVILDYGFLLLFTASEVLAYLYFFDHLKPRGIRRFLLPVILCGVLFLWNVLSMTAKQTRDIYSILYVLEYYLTLILFVRLYCGSRWRETFYTVVVLFLTTRFVRHLIGHVMISMQSTNYLVEGSIWAWRFCSCVGLFIVYLLLFTPVRKMTFRYELQDQNPFVLALIALSVVPVVYIGTFAETLGQESWARGLEAISIEGIASICGFLTIIGYQRMMDSQKKEQELQRMQTILTLQHQQVEKRQETMEQVNQKYHDMKNHLQVLMQMEDNVKCRDYMESLQQEMIGFENFYNTGNATLDVVLSEKQERCRRLGIPLSIIAEGQLLSFMEPIDITTVFANALDNAIEHVSSLEEGQREISVKLIRRDHWCVLRFENHCTKERMDWDKDHLKSTKKEAGHGYGLKSIRYACRKICWDDDAGKSIRKIHPDAAASMSIPLLLKN